MRYTPSHYMKKWHIDHNPDANELAVEEGYENWAEAFNDHWNVNPSSDLDKPMLQHWIFEEFTSTYRTFVRNPYYFAVDRAGNQLPYIDRVVSTIVDPEVNQLRIISGEADIAFMNTSFANYPLYKENEDEGGYRVNLIPGMTGAIVSYYPNQNHPDPVQREIYSDVRFRRALSIAIDRDEINESVFFGVATPRQATIPSAAVYYKPEWGEAHPYAGYDPGVANRLLDEAGLTERDQDGFRKRSDGQTLQLIVQYNSSVSPDVVTVHELVKEFWEDVGVKVLLKPTAQSLRDELYQAGEYDIGTGGQYEHEFKWYIVSPEAGYGYPQYNAYLQAELDIEQGNATLADYDGGVLPGWEPTEDARRYFDLQVIKYAAEFRSDEYLEALEEMFDLVLPSYILTTMYVVFLAPFLLTILSGPNFRDSVIFVILGALFHFFRKLTSIIAMVAHGEMSTKKLVVPYAIGALFSTFGVYLASGRGESAIPLVLVLGGVVVTIVMYIKMQAIVSVGRSYSKYYLPTLLSIPMAISLLFEDYSKGFGMSLFISLVIGLYYLFTLWFFYRNKSIKPVGQK